MRLSSFPRRASALILVASVLGGVTCCISAPLYSAKDLGELIEIPEGDNSKPNAISGNGKVAATNVANGSYRAFLYDGAWTNLGTLGGAHSFAYGLNDAGLVVGRSVTATGVNRAFLWTPGGIDGVASNPQMKDLGALTGGTKSEAKAINTAGQIAGYAETSNRDHAFRYSGGTKTDIGALLPPNLPNSYGLSINDAGHIAGIAYDAAFAFAHAFFYNGTTAVDIGNLGVPGANAMGINSSDHIAGYATSLDFFDHAFHYFGGVMDDLGTLGGDYSYANGINNHNAIVGGSFTDVDNSIYHAFISNGNALRDLNNQLDASGGGWELVDARAINDSGQIVGVGQLGGAAHVFLLNPHPEITGINLNGVNLPISFTTIKTAPYTLESSESLGTGSWSNLITGIIGNGGIMTVTTSIAGLPRRFYRVRLSAP